MLTSTTGTMTTSQSVVPIPTDYLEDKYFTITGTAQARIKRKTMQEVVGSWSYDGTGGRVPTTPQTFYNDQTNIVLDSPCDQPYPYLLYYYQQPTALGTSNTTNFITNTYPRLFRAACMAGAAEFMKDAGVGNYDRGYWEDKAEKEIMVAQSESDRSEHTLDIGWIQT